MGTSSGARRFRDLVHAYISDLGGIDQISEIKLGLLRRLAALIVQCEALESADGEGQQGRPACPVHSSAQPPCVFHCA